MIARAADADCYNNTNKFSSSTEFLSPGPLAPQADDLSTMLRCPTKNGIVYIDDIKVV